MKTFNPNRSGLTFRRTLRIPAGAPLVGLVGRISWEKGPDFFLQMAEYVHGERPDVHFVLVGDGPAEEDIRRQIEEKGLLEVCHMAGVWPNTWEVFPALDVAVLTSRVEGMPFALLEAMACARPVAAMAVGGVREIVEVGTTGMCSASGDFEGLGRAILRLLHDPDLAKQMGQAGRKRVEENYDLRTSVRLMSNLFYRLMGRKPDISSSGAETMLQSNWPAPDPERKSMPIEATQIFRKPS